MVTIESLSKISEFIQYSKGDCPKHGTVDFVQVRDKKPECIHCQKERFDAEGAETTKKIVENARLTAMANCGIQTNKTLDDWQFDENHIERQKKLINNLLGYAHNFRADAPNLLFIGGTGTGKTLLCSGVGRIVFDKKYNLSNDPVRLVKTANITKQVKESWNDKSKPSEKDILSMYAKTQLLILDDLGDGDSVGGESGVNDRLRFGQLIDARYQKAPTIITTNMLVPEIKQFLGDRAWDRFSQNMVVIEFKWLSYRQKTQQVFEW